jgi:SAM-dependent methyltransferase
MDAVAQYNSARWNAMAQAQAVFTRPRLELTPQEAREYLDPQGIAGDVAGKEVLCLASGGGQQSVAFALLGANVTVFDLSEAQLQRDREAATFYQVSIKVCQGDMRDLSRFADGSFDLVWQPYSLNFVPEVAPVFGEVARILRPGGLYHFMCANPFFLGMLPEEWSGKGYPMQRPYISGEALRFEDEAWVFGESAPENLPPPRIEYRHTLSALVNGLARQGFAIQTLMEETLGEGNPNAEPGSAAHFSSIVPLWLIFYARYGG